MASELVEEKTRDAGWQTAEEELDDEQLFGPSDVDIDRPEEPAPPHKPGDKAAQDNSAPEERKGAGGDEEEVQVVKTIRGGASRKSSLGMHEDPQTPRGSEALASLRAFDIRETRRAASEDFSGVLSQQLDLIEGCAGRARDLYAWAREIIEESSQAAAFAAHLAEIAAANREAVARTMAKGESLLRHARAEMEAIRGTLRRTQLQLGFYNPEREGAPKGPQLPSEAEVRRYRHAEERVRASLALVEKGINERNRAEDFPPLPPCPRKRGSPAKAPPRPASCISRPYRPPDMASKRPFPTQTVREAQRRIEKSWEEKDKQREKGGLAPRKEGDEAHPQRAQGEDDAPTKARKRIHLA